jgi:PAS domain-containing protein
MIVKSSGHAARLAAIAIERNQDAEALRHRTEQFETLLNEAPVGAYLVDADFRIREMNPAAQQLFGKSRRPYRHGLGRVDSKPLGRKPRPRKF